MNEELQRLSEDESRKKIGNGGDRICLNANGQQSVKTIPNKETLGVIFRMITREAGLIAGAKMDYLALRIGSVASALLWRCGTDRMLY